jgi:hypothetical protein
MNKEYKNAWKAIVVNGVSRIWLAIKKEPLKTFFICAVIAALFMLGSIAKDVHSLRNKFNPKDWRSTPSGNMRPLPPLF